MFKIFYQQFFYQLINFSKFIWNNKENTSWGDQRISDETIKVLGDIKLNTKYDNDRLNTTLKNLYNSNFFQILI